MYGMLVNNTYVTMFSSGKIHVLRVEECVSGT